METLRTVEILSNAKLTVLAVESVSLRHNRTNTNCRLYGNIEPIAIIVRSRAGTYALDMEAKPVNLDQFDLDARELQAIKATPGTY